MISLFDTSSRVESFKIVKFKRNLKKLIMISVLDSSSTFESFKIIKFKRNLKTLIMISLFYIKYLGFLFSILQG